MLKNRNQRIGTRLLKVLLVVLLIFPLSQFQIQPASAATVIVIPGPANSGEFGYSITVLPNGNFVVADPFFDLGLTQNVGAVYLFDGGSGALISKLSGTTAEDRVGMQGITVLENGNYVVSSIYWSNAGAAEVGAATWGDKTIGISGTVSADNSLIGSHALDRVGKDGIYGLSNGNYTVVSSLWDNGSIQNAGAVTWGSGVSGVSGEVSPDNSLVGGTDGDQVGFNDVFPLANGNYVVSSPYWEDAGKVDVGAATWGNGLNGVKGLVSKTNSLVGGAPGDQQSTWIEELSNSNFVVINEKWDNGQAVDAGAVTWADGDVGITGTVTVTNSLVGSNPDDQVGLGGIAILNNGNYVVSSGLWDNGFIADAGASTWGDGTIGITGVVSSTNSLVGGTDADMVSYFGARPLSNGNYVVLSRFWDNGSVHEAGAATWGNGITGIKGLVTLENSLVGAQNNDAVSLGTVIPLSNGNYVVSSYVASINGVSQAGAVTWGNGATGVSGPISLLNSLVGSTTNDQVGSQGVYRLANGNYVVGTPYWNGNGAVDAGAATFGNGQTGVKGPVSPENSLVGSSQSDRVSVGVTPLANGSYVVCSRYWNNGSANQAGAATWGNGENGITGPVSLSNSLVGSKPMDQVSSAGVIDLYNGNYIVRSPLWDDDLVLDAGVLTWGNGSIGISGTVSSLNSLVGSTNFDELGLGSYKRLDGGDFFTISTSWSNGAVINAGAVTFGFGFSPMTGPLTSQNSVLGGQPNSGGTIKAAFNSFNRQLVVGLPKQNEVVLFRPYFDQFLPVLLK